MTQVSGGNNWYFIKVALVQPATFEEQRRLPSVMTDAGSRRVGLLDRRQMGNFFRYWSALDRNDSTVEIRVGKVASIHFIGIWDTVGSIYAELTTPKLNALSLADTELPHGIGIARHALAYHENRTEFFPTPYVGYDESRDVQQVWFPGGNLDVGGGYSDHLTADLALCWMAGEAHNAGLILEEAFLYDCFVLLDSPDAQLELRLHLGGRDLLAVGHLKMLANLPNRDKTVILPASNPNYMYHQSLWAEIRLASDGPSCKAFDGKAGEPAKKTLTDFEQKYWTMCGWDVSVSRHHSKDFTDLSEIFLETFAE
ncbi:hypothetical protein FRC09_015409 [Ceratobasidium sp. 395]|nr:hypothetical protein FRC09_015409 [Ceratobasidium sp. 395]